MENKLVERPRGNGLARVGYLGGLPRGRSLGKQCMPRFHSRLKLSDGAVYTAHVDLVAANRIVFLAGHASHEPAQQYVDATHVKRINAALTALKVATGYDSALANDVGARITDLKVCAREEGIQWSTAAERQLWEFLEALDSPSRPALAIDQNGDLRALWSNLIQEQVGVRFKGDIEANAVLFAKTEHGMRRETLKADIATIVALVREMKLLHVTRG